MTMRALAVILTFVLLMALVLGALLGLAALLVWALTALTGWPGIAWSHTVAVWVILLVLSAIFGGTRG